MRDTLRVIETEDVVIYNNLSYGPEFIRLSREFFDKLIEEGIITKGGFEDDKWICYSGIKKVEIDFVFNSSIYAKHVGKEFGISFDTMKLMIKCYVIYCTGEYIFKTIAREITNSIKGFLCNYKEREFKLTTTQAYYIEDFLAFINTPDDMIDEVLSNIKKVMVKRNAVRELSPLINYLVIENEINQMFNGVISDEDFIKYFPIYFWVNVTFILPLRATEMLVTPYDCIQINEDDVVLEVRRTTLKGRGKRVHYDVNKDYKIFTYHLRNIIKKQVFETIKRYQIMTKNHERRFLFDYGTVFSNEMLSLSGFNNLIKVFMDDRIKDNPQYEYAKRVCEIDEFEYVTAGDSRPIAMANLWFQGSGADLCRQLANHMHVSTSESYYMNVSETLFYSSIIQMQNRINDIILEDTINRSELVIKDRYNCTSPRRRYDEDDISDCEGHYQDCFGCRFYFPNEKEIKNQMKDRKQECEMYIKKMQSVLTSSNKIKGRDIDIDELFLKVHTSCVRYKESTDVFAEKEARKWVEQQNSQRIYC